MNLWGGDVDGFEVVVNVLAYAKPDRTADNPDDYYGYVEFRVLSVMIDEQRYYPSKELDDALVEQGTTYSSLIAKIETKLEEILREQR